MLSAGSLGPGAAGIRPGRAGLDTLEGAGRQHVPLAARSRRSGQASWPLWPLPEQPWRKMPKRVRPYGSAEDAEFAGLGRSRPRIEDDIVSELGSTMTMPDIAAQAAEAVRELRDLTA